MRFGSRYIDSMGKLVPKVRVAHPTRFGTQMSAGIKYGVPGISKSFSRDYLWTLGKGVLY